MDLSERSENFKKQVFEVGGTIYTKKMLDRFVEHWTEPDRAKKPKMRFEKEPTWETGRRLAFWARRNYDNIPCFLSAKERTIIQKKMDFAAKLQPFVTKYHRDILNAFYRHWTQPENKMVPEYIRWEKEEFWDLPQRLATWADRNQVKNANEYGQRR